MVLHLKFFTERWKYLHYTVMTAILLESSEESTKVRKELWNWIHVNFTQRLSSKHTEMGILTSWIWNLQKIYERQNKGKISISNSRTVI
jgi:hypothetical protein